MTTYLFYDIETTGLNKAFDQIIQFAAIRTDTQLNELERFTIGIRLRPDVIPSPRAMITNRVSIADLASGWQEVDAVREIHRLVNVPGTISLGYNTMSFDDEFLRFSFHRNLLPPYTHQYRNGCGRMDLLPITIIFWLYKREVLSWPEVDGKPSLKLEHLGVANQLMKGPSHDAMVDVETTLKLARCFFAERTVWDHVIGFFDKDTDSRRLDELPAVFQGRAGVHRQGLLVDSEYGVQQNFQIPVLSLGTSIPYPNQTLWLRLDWPGLRDTTPETIAETTWIVRKRCGEPGIILPPLPRFWKHLDPERAQTAAANLKWLMSKPDLFDRIVAYYQEFSYPYIANLDPDAALYQVGFPSRSDTALSREFHTADLPQRIQIADRFAGPEVRVLAKRLLFRNYLAELPRQLRAEFQSYLRQAHAEHDRNIMVDYKGQRRTTPWMAQREIEQVRREENLDDVQRRLLDELEAYIQKTF
jgi:exodeoxyribonuclease-1